MDSYKGGRQQNKRQPNVEPVSHFHLTPHAIRRLAERRICMELVKDTVKYHHNKDFKNPGEHGGKVYRYAKHRSEGTLVVIAELKREECWVITTYYE